MKRKTRIPFIILLIPILLLAVVIGIAAGGDAEWLECFEFLDLFPDEKKKKTR